MIYAIKLSSNKTREVYSISTNSVIFDSETNLIDTSLGGQIATNWSNDYPNSFTNLKQVIATKTSENIGEWEFIQDTNRNAYPDSGNKDGFDYQYIGVPLDNAVTAPKIETGSYVGTGTHGQANPNTLTFGFSPKLVLIYDGSTTYAMFFAFGIGGEYTLGGYLLAWEDSTSAKNNNYARINSNVLNWYASNTSATTARELQLNVESRTYHYFAIG